MHSVKSVHDTAVISTPRLIATSGDGVQNGAIAAMHYDSPHLTIGSVITNMVGPLKIGFTEIDITSLLY